MITENKKKVRTKSQESEKSKDYSEKIENRGNTKCLIEISTYSI